MRYGLHEFVPWKGSDSQVGDVIRVRFDRDSVAMGDDVVSHEEHWTYAADATVDDLLLDVSRAVPGLAGWSVRVAGGRFDREILGVLYFRTDPDSRSMQCSVCRLWRPEWKLADLAGAYGLDLHARYMSSGGQPIDSDELRESRAPRSREATRVWSAESVSSNWRTVAAIRAQESAVRDARRAWLRQILVAQPDPPESDEFVAAAMTTMAAEVSPASLALTAEILGLDAEPRDVDIHLLAPRVPSPRRAVLAMIAGAFEFTISTGSWEHGEMAGLAPYFSRLEAWGWRLAPAELVLAGRMAVAELLADD